MMMLMLEKPCLALDIGGTLTKLCVFVPKQFESDIPTLRSINQSIYERRGSREANLEVRLERGTIHFIRFLTSRVEDVVETIQELVGIPNHHQYQPTKNPILSGLSLCVTGGGAFKHDILLQNAFKTLKLSKVDEMQSLFLGLQVALNLGKEECFKLKRVRFAGMIGAEREKIEVEPISLQDHYLFANVGSGVSFLNVTGENFVRVGGSSLGGATFLGLTSLLCSVESFDEAIDLASQGDSTLVDFLVKDIYGGLTSVLGPDGKPLLRPSALAASFGKMIHKDLRQKARREDLSLAVLMMISLNVAAIAVLHAKMSKSNFILFSGSFLATSGNSEILHMDDPAASLYLHRRNTLAMRTLSYAVSFWSNDLISAVFLKREGFLGALGALKSISFPELQSQSKL